MTMKRFGDETRKWPRVNLCNYGNTGRTRETRAEFAVLGDSGIE